MIESLVKTVNGFLWDYFLLFVLVGTGIWFTVKLNFVQIWGFKEGFTKAFGGMFKKDKSEKEGISSFQSLATAVASQVGTGNLAGVATAIAAGGPGAIFWMWVSAFFGMATIYSEATMAQKFRQDNGEGGYIGGPAYYIRGIFGGAVGKILAALFAVFGVFALGFMGNAVQSNSIADAFNIAFGINPMILGVLLAVLGFFVFTGGVNRIVKVTEIMVPFMALFYIAGCIIVLVIRIKFIPLAFYEIIVGAFSPQAITGGVLGATVKQAMKLGVARGLFSNEAGMGSTPHAHAIADVDHPSEQGFVAIMGVFIDTLVILNLTALVIITTRSVTPDGALEGVALTQAAFTSVFGSFGNTFIAICMLFFAFSTIIGWYFFGEINITYLFKGKYKKVYALLVCGCIILGAVAKVNLVWNMADCFNGLMVIPNLIGLIAMTGIIKEVEQDYVDNYRNKE